MDLDKRLEEIEAMPPRLRGWAKAEYAESDNPGLVKALCEAAVDIETLLTELRKHMRVSGLAVELIGVPYKSDAWYPRLERLEEAARELATITPQDKSR